jgi:hypothetical protein
MYVILLGVQRTVDGENRQPGASFDYSMPAFAEVRFRKGINALYYCHNTAPASKVPDATGELDTQGPDAPLLYDEIYRARAEQK